MWDSACLDTGQFQDKYFYAYSSICIDKRSEMIEKINMRSSRQVRTTICLDSVLFGLVWFIAFKFQVFRISEL